MANQGRKSVLFKAGDEATQLSLRDSKWNELASGVGSIRCDLIPGTYSVWLETGGSAATTQVEITPEKKEQIIRLDKVPYFTSAPFAVTKLYLFFPYHPKSALVLSLSSHNRLSSGNTESEVFIFISECGDKQVNCAWTGLTLCNLEGTVIADLSRNGEQNDKAGYAGCVVAVTPGRYRLRVQTEFEGTYEMMVVACRGWQTQVFLADKKYGTESKSSYHADLNTASILMTRLGEGFNPVDEGARLTDLARIALLHHRYVIQPEVLHQYVIKADNHPMLGLFGLWGILLHGKEDLAFLQLVQKRLEEQIGDHPDVQLLKLHPRLMRDGWNLSEADGQYPPMLWNTWRMIVRKTAEFPNLVPTHSLSSRAANGSWGDGPLLVWRNFPEFSEKAPQSISEDAVTKSPRILRGLVRKICKTSRGRKHLQLIESKCLPLERVVLDVFQSSLQDQPANELNLKELVNQIGAPVAAILQTIEAVTEKINSFDLKDYLGRELKKWAERLEEDDDRRIKFHQLVQEAISLFPKEESNVDWQLVVIADKYKWPVWAVRCLPKSNFFKEEKEGEWIAFICTHIINFIPDLSEPSITLCNGEMAQLRIPSSTVSWLLPLTKIFDNDRNRFLPESPHTLVGIFNHSLLQHLKRTSSSTKKQIPQVGMLREQELPDESPDTPENIENRYQEDASTSLAQSDEVSLKSDSEKIRAKEEQFITEAGETICLAAIDAIDDQQIWKALDHQSDAVMANKFITEAGEIYCPAVIEAIDDQQIGKILDHQSDAAMAKARSSAA